MKSDVKRSIVGRRWLAPAVFLSGTAAGACLLGFAWWMSAVVRHRPAIPATYLHAEAASQGESVAVATGAIDEEIEGLFTIDFLTGDLRCFVLYVKSTAVNKVGGQFARNVVEDLGMEKGKKPRYLLVTGRANFARGAAGARPGFSVVYVIDDNTGKWAAYGVPWDKTQVAKGMPQKGTLVLVGHGTARTARIRDEP